MVKQQNIEINIDELVLHGFSSGDRYRIGEALQLELIRLFTEGNVPLSLTRGIELTRLDAGTFNMAPNSKPEVIGTQVAKSIYNRFSQ